MIYEFRRIEDGAIVEASLPMSQAPDFGQVVVIGGKPCIRIASSPAFVRGDNWKPYVSHRLPRNLKGVKCDPHGKPIVESRSQEREIAAKLGWERE